MLTIYDSHHIPTNRHRKGHMACRTHTGVFMGNGEARRVYQAHVDLINRRIRLGWLVQQWVGHQAHIAFTKKEEST